MPIRLLVVRWTGMYALLERYNYLRDFLYLFENEVNDNISQLVPTASENVIITNKLKELEVFIAVTLELQNDKISLADVHDFFEILLKNYPNLQSHISRKSKVIVNPAFENAIIKIQSKKEDELTDEEEESVSRFRKDDFTISNNETTANISNSNDIDNFLYQVSNVKKQRLEPKSKYCDLSWIPATTTNIVERFFSNAKLTLTDSRKSILPQKLEMMLLKMNPSLWNASLVSVALQGCSDE